MDSITIGLGVCVVFFLTNASLSVAPCWKNLKPEGTQWRWKRMPDIDNTLNRHPTTIYNGSETAQQPKSVVSLVLNTLFVWKIWKGRRKDSPIFVYIYWQEWTRPFSVSYSVIRYRLPQTAFLFFLQQLIYQKKNKNVVAVEKIYSLLVEIKRSKYAHIIIRLIGES